MSIDILGYSNDFHKYDDSFRQVKYHNDIKFTNINNLRKRNCNQLNEHEVALNVEDTKVYYNSNKYSRIDSYNVNIDNKSPPIYNQQSQTKKRRFDNELNTVNTNVVDFSVKKSKITEINDFTKHKLVVEKTNNGNYHHLLNIHDFAKEQIDNALELTVSQLISNRLLSKQITDNLDTLKNVLMEVNNLVLPMYVHIYTEIVNSISSHEQEISDQVITAFYSNTTLSKTGNNSMDCSYIQ